MVLSPIFRLFAPYSMARTLLPWRAGIPHPCMEKILVVEDDRATRKALQQLFEPEGYAVEVAQNGVEGLARFRAARPNFVILDLGLPQIGGQDVCRQIRKESEEAPILILTGSSDEISRVLLLELGADDYVTKPFSPKELLARVRAVLRRARRGPMVEGLHFDDVDVDFSKMEAVRGSRDGRPHSAGIQVAEVFCPASPRAPSPRSACTTPPTARCSACSRTRAAASTKAGCSWRFR
jgi:DNA-binding response OmpR family regulator